MPTALDHELLQRILRRALRRGGAAADVFFEHRRITMLRLEQGRIRDASVSVICGASVRVIAGEQAGFAHSDDLDETALLAAADTASLIARDGRPTPVASACAAHVPHALYGAHSEQPADASRYAELLARADGAARAFDPRVQSVSAFVSDELQHVQIAHSDGRIVTDRRPLVTLNIQVYARDGAQRENGSVGDGGRGGLDVFDTRTPEMMAREAARIATLKLGARPAPSGEMPVVIGSGGGGVLLHEAVGHGLEGDFNRKRTSLYSGRVGERVASELVTIHDDGDVPGERGTVAVDDEGVPGQPKVLIENGVLRGYMHDRINGALMGTGSTGSGRRHSFRSMPLPRMCNTYMAGGSATTDEIVGSVERGLYASSFTGGQVEIGKGDFVFMIAEGYLIENGRITAPVRGATLMGNGPDIMTKVTHVGADPRFAERWFSCGKSGQYVAVGVGSPTFKVAACTVGGTARA